MAAVAILVLALGALGVGLSALLGGADHTPQPRPTELPASQPVGTTLVSAGPRPVAVPALVGLREGAVRAALEAAGLAPGVRRGAFHPTAPPGEVIDQSPPAGAELLPGGAVDYTVSAGPRPVASDGSP